MNAYIVAASRSAVGKATRGGFRFTRPDTLAADVIKHLVASVPNVHKDQMRMLSWVTPHPRPSKA